MLVINYSPELIKHWSCNGGTDIYKPSTCCAPKEEQTGHFGAPSVVLVEGVVDLCPWCLYKLPRLFPKEAQAITPVRLFMHRGNPYAFIVEKIVSISFQAAYKCYS